MSQRPRAIIVDAYSTGRYLAPLLLAQGWDCVHVQSLPTPAFGYGHDTSHFIAGYVHDGRLDGEGIGELAAVVRRETPRAIFAGSESAVPLTDLLADSLSLAGNPAVSARARRDKFTMQEALRLAGIEVARSIAAYSSSEARMIASEIGLPVVVKPVLSAAAEDVTFCWDMDRVSTATANTLGKRNALGLVNEAVLVQEMLFGAEYIVNSVSRGARHCISELWRCRKIRQRDGKRLSALEELVPVASSTEIAILDFARSVLDAVGIAHGPSHIELILTDDGCRLIEVAARPQGGVDPDAIVSAIGTSHPHLTVESIVRPALFDRRSRDPNLALRRVYRVILRADRRGTIVAMEGLEEVRRMPSYFSDSVALKAGDSLVETIDFATTPGVVHLVHQDLRQLERDYREIRRLETDQRMFQLAPSSQVGEVEAPQSIPR